MNTVALKAETRAEKGKELVKKLRYQQKVPAVVYGRGVHPVHLTVNLQDLMKVLHAKRGANVLVNLQIPGSKQKDRTVIIKEIQHHPVTDEIYHVDFNIVSLTEKIRVKVPLHEFGEAPGVVKGGVLDHVHREIEVECLPTEIPEKIEVDISQLDFGNVIHVRDLKIPKGVDCVMGSEEVVFTVIAPRQEEPSPEAATAGEAVEPEVIKKGKEEEAEEEGAPEKVPGQPKAGAQAKPGAAPPQAKAGGAQPKEEKGKKGEAPKAG